MKSKGATVLWPIKRFSSHKRTSSFAGSAGKYRICYRLMIQNRAQFREAFAATDDDERIANTNSGICRGIETELAILTDDGKDYQIK